MNARYVFVGSEGDAIFRTADEPTAEDLDHALNGQVTILRLADLNYYAREGRWLPISEGQLGAVEVEGELTPPFHAPGSHFRRADES